MLSEDIIKVTNLNKMYPRNNVEAVKDVSFVVARGDFVSIMGPSGCGKTTLLHLLGGIIRPTAGEIELDDMKYSELSDNEICVVRREKIGFIFQFCNLFPALTVEENILLPLLISGQNPKTAMIAVGDIIGLMGLSVRKKHRPAELSAGEQQLVALSRAFVAKPPIILADEPCGNLNTKAGEAMLILIRKSCEESGLTVILTTHSVRDAAFSDKVFFFKDGLIVDALEIKKDKLNARHIHDRVQELNF